MNANVRAEHTRTRVSARGIEQAVTHAGGATGVPELTPWTMLTQVALVRVNPDDRFFWQDPAHFELCLVDETFRFVFSRVARKQGATALMAEHLPGFSREAAEGVLNSKAARVVLWQRAELRCPRCAAADMRAADDAARGRWERVLVCPACGAQVHVGRERIAAP